MKKIYLSTLVGAFCSLSLFSCSDLDEKVYSSITEQNYQYSENDFDSTVASVYSFMRNLPSEHGYFVAQEVSADGIVMPPNASGWDDGGVYRRMHYHTWNSEQTHVGNVWGNFYQGAILCNKVIEQIEEGKVPAASENIKQQGLAEVRAMRAFYYWQIMDNFGDAPLVTTTTMELPAKIPRKEIFAFIEQELKEVIPQLTEEVSANTYGRMIKWGAKALLANLYLNAKVYTGEARWNDCLTQCDDIINSGKYQLASDYKEPFRSVGSESCKEIIFGIPFDSDYGFGNWLYLISWNAALKDKFQTEMAPFGAGCAMGVTQFINTYHERDCRLADSWLMGEQLKVDGTPCICTYDKAGQPLVYTKEVPSASFTSETEGYRMNKYEVVPHERWTTNTDIPFYRYAEVLLMKAECLLRTNQAGAGALVTQVRQRAFKENPELAAVTDAELAGNSCYEYGYVEDYKIVDKGDTSPVEFGRLYDELGWEFAWEMHRRRDAIRFGVYTTKSWLSHKPQGDYRSVFPIPESVLTSNPKLEQNPNYLSK